MTDATSVTIAPGIETILQQSLSLRSTSDSDSLCLNHLLLTLLTRNSALVKGLVSGQHGIITDESSFIDWLRGSGPGQSIECESLLAELRQQAAAKGKTTAYEKDLTLLVLMKAGIPLAMPAANSASSVSPSTEAPASPTKLTENLKAGAPHKTERPVRISTLLEVGRDLSKEAREGRLLPVVGRERELREVVETLCRRTKRNPVLVGPAGVGKTAIVEGLAQAVANGLVPEILQGVTIILLQPSLIVAGAGQVGAIEKRMKMILAEAAQEGIILFIDEVHCIVGAGGPAGTGDIASLMKPALARGDIACIAATTDDEYRRFIEQDPALERRFNVVRVQEMQLEEAFEVLKSVRDDLQRLRGISMDDAVVRRIMDYAAQYMRNRTFPDKGVDLLEQCVANALARGDRQVDLQEAEDVVQRMIGIPVNLEHRLDEVRRRLVLCSLLKESTIDSLLQTLNVTMRGLDSKDARPNAVLLLTGNSAREGENIAECLSSALFESPARVIKIDLGRMVVPSDITLLLGAPPGYVGYSDSLPIHRIKQFPWSIVLFENVDKCGQHIQQVVAQAFKDGYFVDGQSRKIFVSDIIALLTARGIDASAKHSIGFGASNAPSHETGVDLAKANLDAALSDAINLVVSEIATPAKGDDDSSLKVLMIEEYTSRFTRQGINLQCDQSLLAWFDDIRQSTGRNDLGGLLDSNVSPFVLDHIKEHRAATSLKVKYLDGRIVIE